MELGLLIPIQSSLFVGAFWKNLPQAHICREQEVHVEGAAVMGVGYLLWKSFLCAYCLQIFSLRFPSFALLFWSAHSPSFGASEVTICSPSCHMTSCHLLRAQEMLGLEELVAAGLNHICLISLLGTCSY